MFGVGNDLRLNSFEERGDKPIQTTLNDPLKALESQSQDQGKKNLKMHSMGLFKVFGAKVNFKKGTPSTSDDQTLVNLIYVQERIYPSTSRAN